jgi:hypothetical protein
VVKTDLFSEVNTPHANEVFTHFANPFPPCRTQVN